MEIDMSAKCPPSSLQVEQAILSAFLVAGEILDIHLEKVKPEYFYDVRHETIFNAMLSLYYEHKSIDMVTVSQHLRNTGRLQSAGGEMYIVDLSRMDSVFGSIETYIQELKNKYMLRELIKITYATNQECFDSPDAQETLTRLHDRVFRLICGRDDKDIFHIRDVLQEVYDDMVKKYEKQGSLLGISTGFHELDEMIDGLQPQHLVVLAARPGVGKTTLALNIAENVAIHQNKPVLFFSLEMSKKELAKRVLSSSAKLSGRMLSKGSLNVQQWNMVSKSLWQLGDIPLYLSDLSDLSVDMIRSRAKRLKALIPNLGLIVVDYLQIVKALHGQHRNDQIAAISRELKLTARSLDVPVIALSQLNRAVESRNDKRPVLSDLRDSGSIEQDSDVVGFIYRSNYQNKDIENPETELIIAKNRHGRTGVVELDYQPDLTRFANKLR
jgi:replicative DNA helicase